MKSVALHGIALALALAAFTTGSEARGKVDQLHTGKFRIIARDVARTLAVPDDPQLRRPVA